MDPTEDSEVLDLAHQIDLIHAALIDDIEEFRREKQYLARRQSNKQASSMSLRGFRNTPDSDAPKASAKLPDKSKAPLGAVASIDFSKLADLKLLFDRPHLGGTVLGIPEVEFKRKFAPVFCTATDSDGIDEWFLHIDHDAVGYVDWLKFTNYLMGPQGASVHMQRTVTYGVKCITGENCSPGHAIIRCVYDGLQDILFCASSDGCVRAYNAATLKIMCVVHFADGGTVLDLKIVEEKAHVYVALTNGLVFLYECGGMRVRHQATLLRAYRIASSATSLGLRKHVTMQKTVPFDPLRMVLAQGFGFIAGSRPSTIKTEVEVGTFDVREACHCAAGLRAKRGNSAGGQCTCSVFRFGGCNEVMCMEPAHVLFPHAKDPNILFGLEYGKVALYQTDMLTAGSTCPIVAGWKPHTDWVTKIMATTINPQVHGFITSSLDASIQVMDVEKKESSLRMVDTSSSGGGRSPRAGTAGRHGADQRAILGFDFAPHWGLLASFGNTRAVNLWAATACCKIATFTEHKGRLVDVVFNEKVHQLITMSADKVVKIWDLRTLRSVQTISDKEPRFPNDEFSALEVDRTRGALISCAACPIMWRDTGLEKKQETGVMWSAEYDGHITPVLHCAYSAKFVITADEKNVLVWTVKTGDLFAKWATEGRITCLCFDTNCRRVIVGDERGSVDMWAINNGKKLKHFRGGPSEIAGVTHLQCVAESKDASQESYTVATCITGRIVFFWYDRKIISTTSRVPEVLVAYAVDALDHASDHRHTGNITVLQKLPPNRVIVGTSVGDFLVIAVSGTTMPSLLACLPSCLKSVVSPSMFGAKQRGSVSARRSKGTPTGAGKLKSLRFAPVLNTASGESSRRESHRGPTSPRGSGQMSPRGTPQRRSSRGSVPVTPSRGGEQSPVPFAFAGTMDSSMMTSIRGGLNSSCFAGESESFVSPRSSLGGGGGGGPPKKSIVGGLLLEQRQAQRQALSPIKSLWLRTLDVVKKERSLGGADFTRFKQLSQNELNIVTENLIAVGADYVLALYGDGDAVLWNVSTEHWGGLEIVASFPASYTLGESATAGAFCTADGMIYIGDAQAVISGFDVSHLVNWKTFRAGSFDNISSCTSQGSTGRVHHNMAGVRLQKVLAIPLSSITAMDCVEPYNLLVVCSNDCNVVIVDTGTGLIMGKLGFDRVDKRTWPILHDDGTWHPPESTPTRNHPELEDAQAEPQLHRAHRFAHSFPTFTDNAVPLRATEQSVRSSPLPPSSAGGRPASNVTSVFGMTAYHSAPASRQTAREADSRGSLTTPTDLLPDCPLEATMEGGGRRPSAMAASTSTRSQRRGSEATPTKAKVGGGDPPTEETDEETLARINNMWKNADAVTIDGAPNQRATTPAPAEEEDEEGQSGEEEGGGGANDQPSPSRTEALLRILQRRNPMVQLVRERDSAVDQYSPSKSTMEALNKMHDAQLRAMGGSGSGGGGGGPRSRAMVGYNALRTPAVDKLAPPSLYKTSTGYGSRASRPSTSMK